MVPPELVGILPHPHCIRTSKLVTQHRNPHKIALFHFILFAAGLLPLPWWEFTSPRQRLKPVGALVKPGSSCGSPGEAWELRLPPARKSPSKFPPVFFLPKFLTGLFFAAKKFPRVLTMTNTVFSLVTTNSHRLFILTQISPLNFNTSYIVSPACFL